MKNIIITKNEIMGKRYFIRGTFENNNQLYDFHTYLKFERGKFPNTRGFIAETKSITPNLQISDAVFTKNIYNLETIKKKLDKMAMLAVISDSGNFE